MTPQKLEEREIMLNLHKQFNVYLKTFKSILTPWRHNIDEDYYRGWNDCIKQMNKNYKKIIKNNDMIREKYLEAIENENH